MLKTHKKPQIAVTDKEINSRLKWALLGVKSRRFIGNKELGDPIGKHENTIGNYLDFDQDLPEAMITLLKMLRDYGDEFVADAMAIIGYAGARKINDGCVDVFELSKVSSELNAQLSTVIFENQGRVPNTKLKEITDKALEVSIASGSFVQSARRALA